MGPQNIDVLEERFGIRFKNRELIKIALTHSSAGLGISNERLEFLGDSVLQLVVSRHLYRRAPSLDEGELTKLRARFVNKNTLAQVALRAHLDDLLTLGDSLKKPGEAPQLSILADAYEALIGAIYLDRGMKMAQRFVRFTLLREVSNIKFERDFKSELQEKVIKTFRCYPNYRLLKADGPQHAKRFRVEVKVNGRGFGIGEGRSRKEAEKEAAKKALLSWKSLKGRQQGR